MSAFNWEDFCDLANEWDQARAQAQQWDEARCRCIVSRAYYGVWNLCREYARSQNAIRPLRASGSSHDDVIQWFYAGESAQKSIASNLDRLKRARVQADYQRPWGKSTPTQAAENALFYANRVLNSLTSL